MPQLYQTESEAIFFICFIHFFINSENNSSQYFSVNDLTSQNYDPNNDFSVIQVTIK